MRKLHSLLLIVLSCAACLPMVSHYGWTKDCGDGAPINNFNHDMELIFFPSFATQGDVAGSWKIAVHAWAYEPEKESVKRKILINLMKRDFGLKDSDMRTQQFETMAGYLLVDQEGSREIAVDIGKRLYCIGKTDRNGHAESTVTVDERELGTSTGNEGAKRYIEFCAESSASPKRTYAGRARIIGKKGVMVVSDIDDTIKISNVRDKKTLIENTLCRPFVPVPAMAGLYRRMARAGALIHYVSASPWQLYIPLAEFLKREGFPEGLFYMKVFGFSNNLSALMAPSESVKKPYIEGIMKQFSGHRFIFIGDSGERDPELYGDFARKNPRQVAGVYIRNVTDEKRDSRRLDDAFRGVPASQWRLFRDAGEIETEIMQRAGATF